MNVRGRFAPSPTGDLHVGNARTALLAWLDARWRGGRFIMRVEDLDVGRVRPEFEKSQLDDLRWLGLDWDEGPGKAGLFGPYLQSERGEIYHDALDQLRKSGLVYACSCTRREIAAAASAPHAEEEEGPPYPGTCRQTAPPDDRTPVALRFRVPDKPVEFDDAIRGRIVTEPARQGGDFVIRRKDGVVAYQLAVVVDDAAMGITHVVRGADLILSTGRQILLYRALGKTPPRWVHVPLMLHPNGERLAKRDRSLMIRSVRERGVTAERLVGWLAETCGLIPPGAEVHPAELIEVYRPDRLPKKDTPVEFPAWLAPPT